VDSAPEQRYGSPVHTHRRHLEYLKISLDKYVQRSTLYFRQSMAPTGRERALDTRLEIRISSAVKAELEKEAAKDRRPLSDYIRLALEDHIAAKRGRKGR
jgi:hypothetical protein